MKFLVKHYITHDFAEKSPPPPKYCLLFKYLLQMEVCDVVCFTL